MNAELAAAVADPFAQHRVFAKLAVEQAESVALLFEDRDAPFDTLLGDQFGMLEVVAQHRLDQGRRVRPQAEQAQVGQQAFPVQFPGLADLFPAQSDEGEQLSGERIARAALEAHPVTVLAPDRQQQPMQAVMEEIEEVPRRIALLAVAQGLFAVERRQRRTGTEQADQVETQPRPQHAALFEELHPIDIAAREAEARIGLEFQLIVERLVSQAGMFLAQAIHDQQDRLEQRVLANAPGQRAYSRGCKPMRGFHWYTSPCVLLTRNSW